MRSGAKIWLATGVFLALGLLLAAGWAAASTIRYIKAHDCRRTGATEVRQDLLWLHDGRGALIPVPATKVRREYLCNNGTRLWF